MYVLKNLDSNDWQYFLKIEDGFIYNVMLDEAYVFDEQECEETQMTLGDMGYKYQAIDIKKIGMTKDEKFVDVKSKRGLVELNYYLSRGYLVKSIDQTIDDKKYHYLHFCLEKEV